MTDKQSEALELASLAECANLADYPTAKKANAYYLCLLEDCARMIRRLHAENEALRMDYAAARLEIALRKGHADELAVAYMCGASWGERACSTGGKEAMTTDAQLAPTDDEIDALLAAQPAPTTQPSPAAQGDALDAEVLRGAERYRFIRDVPYSDDVRSVLVHQQNAAMDRVIDAARAAQEGKSHD